MSRARVVRRLPAVRLCAASLALATGCGPASGPVAPPAPARPAGAPPRLPTGEIHPWGGPATDVMPPAWLTPAAATGPATAPATSAAAAVPPTSVPATEPAAARPAVPPADPDRRIPPDQRRALAAAARRAGHVLPPDDGDRRAVPPAPETRAVDRPEQERQDYVLASRFLSVHWDLSDEEQAAVAAVVLADRPPPPHEEAAAKVARRDLTDLTRWVRTIPRYRRPALTGVLLRHGKTLAEPLLDQLVLCREDERETMFAAFREFAAADPGVAEALLAAARSDERVTTGQRLAVEALDEIGFGAGAVPLPDGTVELWRSLSVGYRRKPLAKAAAVALRRRGLLAPRDEQVIAAADDLDDRHVPEALDQAPAARAVARLAGLADRELAALALARLLEDDNRAYRRMAAHALGRAGPQAAAAAADALLAVVDPPDVAADADRGDLAVAVEAEAALSQIGPAAADRVIPAAREMIGRGRWARAFDLLGGVGPAAVPVLVDVRDAAARPTVRRAAVRALGRPLLAGPSAEAALAAVFQSSADPVERALAAAALRTAVTARAGGVGRLALQAALGDAEPNIRATAADALAVLGPADRRAAAAAVLPWLAGDDRQARAAAAELTALAGPEAPPEAVGHLLRMADNVHPDLRYAAARALAAVDPDGGRSGPALVAAVLQRDRAMADLLLPPACRAKDPAVLARLKAAAADEPDAEVRAAAARVVAELER